MTALTPGWFDNPEFWEVNRKRIWSRERVEMSPVAAKKIAQFLGMKPGDSILDMACGFGRYSIAFSKQGFSVTGVDLNSAFIHEASLMAADLKLDARFCCADMLNFVEPDSFDNVIFMYNSFGYFLDPENDKIVLRNSLKSLKPGGKILLQVPNREGCRRGRYSNTVKHWHEEKNGIVRLEEAIANDDWTWNTTRWIIIDGNERTEYSYGIRLYDKTELSTLLDSEGFCNVQVNNNLGCEPYSDDSFHMIVSAEKPMNSIE